MIAFTVMLPTAGMAGKKILFIGDSITDGAWGNSGGRSKPSAERSLSDMNHIYGHGFMFLCAAHYQSKYPSKEFCFYNRGISGNTLADLEQRWQADAIDINPDVLSILIGTNDIDAFMQKGEGPFDFVSWEQRYRKLLNASLETNPDIKIVLCAPFVANTGKMKNKPDYDKRAELIRECDAVVKRIATDYKAVYLPFDLLFEKLMRKTPETQSTYWIWDGIHPTAAGHQRMADMWIKAVDRNGLLK